VKRREFITLIGSTLDRVVLLLDVAELTQMLPEGVDRHERLGGLRPSSQEGTNLQDFRYLLRSCRKRRAAKHQFVALAARTKAQSSALKRAVSSQNGA
jgi:hypothetical protein